MTPTEHLNLVRKKLDSLVKLRELRPLGPKAEETYRVLCDREQELLKVVHLGPAPDCLVTNRPVTPPICAEPPEVVNGWRTSLLETSPRDDNAEAQLGSWSEPSAVYWPFP
ncbi:MAG: hypothetical protein ACLP7F_17190 [Acidimicrobiales bacterium]|jgi:hypothetical protein